MYLPRVENCQLIIFGWYFLQVDLFYQTLFVNISTTTSAVPQSYLHLRTVKKALTILLFRSIVLFHKTECPLTLISYSVSKFFLHLPWYLTVHFAIAFMNIYFNVAELLAFYLLVYNENGYITFSYIQQLKPSERGQETKHIYLYILTLLFQTKTLDISYCPHLVLNMLVCSAFQEISVKDTTVSKGCRIMQRSPALLLKTNTIHHDGSKI